MAGDVAGVNKEEYQYNPKSETKTESQQMDKYTFLKLFMAQLQYQDPTAPQDTNQFMAQLAQFSTLEQLTSMNSEIEQLRQSQQMSEAAALIGRQVTVLTSDYKFVDGEVEKASMINGAAYVTIDGGLYGLDDVTEVRPPGVLADRGEETEEGSGDEGSEKNDG